MYVGSRQLLVANDYVLCCVGRIMFRVSKGLLAVGCWVWGWRKCVCIWYLLIHSPRQEILLFTWKLIVRCCRLYVAFLSCAASCRSFSWVLKNLVNVGWCTRRVHKRMWQRPYLLRPVCSCKFYSNDNFDWKDEFRESDALMWKATKAQRGSRAILNLGARWGV
jgi:hypothetical protein